MGAFDFLDIQTQAGLPAMGLLKPNFWIIRALPWVFGVAGIILLLNIISSGLKMMTSQGDPKVLQGAQAKLTTSAIGILILIISFWLAQLILKFLGVTTVIFN